MSAEENADDSTDKVEGGPEAPLTREIRVAVPTARALRAGLRSPRALSVVALVVSLAAMGWASITARRFQAFATADIALDALRDSMSNSRADSALRRWEIEQVIDTHAPVVDLTLSTLQPIGSGFLVSELAVTNAPAGANISGLIVNTQAVDFQTAQFDLRIGAVAKEVAVYRLVGGGSTRFKVLIPGVSAESARFGTIKYKEATIAFRRPQ